MVIQDPVFLKTSSFVQKIVHPQHEMTVDRNYGDKKVYSGEKDCFVSGLIDESCFGTKLYNPYVKAVAKRYIQSGFGLCFLIFEHVCVTLSSQSH